MIALQNIFLDFILHYIVLLVLGIFLQLLLRSEKGISVGAAFFGAAVITLVNHLYFPQYRLVMPPILDRVEPMNHNQNRPLEASQLPHSRPRGMCGCRQPPSYRAVCRAVDCTYQSP